MTQLVPSLLVSSNASISRRRELPVIGKALVKIGDRVSPAQIVSRGEIAGEIVVVNPTDELGVDSQLLKNAMQVKVGDSVSRGDTLVSISYFFGLIKDVVTSPIDGTVAFITSEQGRIGIQMPSTVAERIAYCGGLVTAVEDGGAVEIAGRASIVQGIFGVGGERVGAIKMLEVDLHETVEKHMLPAECHGAILVGGMCPADGVLHEATRRGAVGFVCGSISSTLLGRYVGTDIGVAVTGDEPVSMSLIVTEGFGAIPLSPRVHAVCAAKAGQAAAINGTTQVRAGAVRPEVIIPLDAASSDSQSIDTSILPALKTGCRIRLIRYPFFGAYGTVTKLPDELTKIDTGAEVRILVTRLDDGREIVVPRANIELVGARGVAPLDGEGVALADDGISLKQKG